MRTASSGARRTAAGKAPTFRRIPRSSPRSRAAILPSAPSKSARSSRPLSFRWPRSGAKAAGMESPSSTATWRGSAMPSRPVRCRPMRPWSWPTGAGRIMATVPGGPAGLGSLLPASLMPLVTAGQAGTRRVAWIDGSDRIAGYLPVDTAPMKGVFVAIGVSRADALASIQAASRRTQWLFGLTLVLAAAFAWWSGYVFVRKPIRAPRRRRRPLAAGRPGGPDAHLPAAPNSRPSGRPSTRWPRRSRTASGESTRARSC